MSSGSKSCNVRRRTPEMISPAKPTPRETKLCSDIDNQNGVRTYLSLLFFYRGNDKNVGPVRVIREALAENLVYYYPYAGRLREGSDRKLMVDCTAEGAVFVEAEADVALDYFGGDSIQPPIPCVQELLPEADPSVILNSPLFLIQVTRLRQGSFVVGVRYCHVMSEGIGMTLFMKTLGEFARAASAPSVPPVWERHLLTARNPPHVTHPHPEYDNAPAGPDDLLPQDQQFQRSFFFGPTEISKLRALAPADIRDSLTEIELIGTVLWRCRTIALSPDPKAERRLSSAIDVRPRLNNPPLPKGYYGNAFAFYVAIAKVEDITSGSLESLIRLVHDANVSITDEYVRSVIDLLKVRNYPAFAMAGTYVVADVWTFGLDEVDFGWGKPVFSGIPAAGSGEFYGLSYFIPYTNKDGVSGTLVPIILPEPLMKKFSDELARILGPTA